MAARHVTSVGHHRNGHPAMLLVRGVLAGALLILLIAGIPWGLLRYVGWPLPDRVPVGEEITAALASPMSTSLLLNTLACLLWAAWASFVVDVLRTAGEAAQGITRSPRRPENGSVHTMATALVGAVVLALLPYRDPHLAAASHRRPAAVCMPVGEVRTASSTEDLGEEGLYSAGGRPRTVVVRAPHDGVHESLWRIAERHLGDGSRWPEVYALNRGRPQPDGRTLVQPHLIRPGWILRLPNTPADPDGDRTPERDREPPTPSSPPTSGGGPQSPAPPHEPSTHGRDGSGAEPGLDLPSGAFIGAGLTVAVAAAAAVVLRRRRIRYQPGSGERSDVRLAPVVRALRAASEELRPEADDSTSATAPPGSQGGDGSRAEGLKQRSAEPTGQRVIGTKEGQALAWDLARSRGLGLAGPGALDAARALLIHLLAEHHATAQRGAELVIPLKDARRLLGTNTAHGTQPAGLHIVATLDEALHMIEAELLTRTRLAEDPDRLVGEKPGEVVLLATPSPAEEGRLQSVLDSGSVVGVCGILLGQWRPGETLRIDTDGSVAAASGPHAVPFNGARLFTLPATDTQDLYDLLLGAATAPLTKDHESHRDVEAPPAAPPARPEVQSQTSQGPVATPQPQGHGGRPWQSRHPEQRALRLVVLGHVRLTYQPQGPAGLVELTQALAPKQREVLAYLALHEDGARREALTATIWPDAPRERPYNSLHATLSQLRRALRLATHDEIADIPTHTGTQYVLNSEHLTVDLWEFEQAVRAAREPGIDEAAHEESLRQATRLYVGDFAAELTAEWLLAPREALRRDYLDAVSALVHMRCGTDPREALDLLEQARVLDPYNEAIYRDIARMQARMGLSDAVSRTFDLLRRALAELGESPSRSAVDWYEDLQFGQFQEHPGGQAE
ncbi:BTAD domain-containing putative transcriptional regulator [Streptomyces sp. NRRL B-1347]|uniref:BTAD domain-containing putative transcriptional regulator n=1 Tax=Streptomyces sp. NRRL B-1347 TaxID=1476877 RepID=UPI00099C8128|nr:BTAD domain-containing putative transcriptional regulator [Streptomyces sp. NRRL B-1347]